MPACLPISCPGPISFMLLNPLSGYSSCTTWTLTCYSLLLISISQLSYIQRVRRQCCLVWLEEKISFVRSWSSAQCGNQPQGKVLWRSWFCDVHSAGKDNTWLKRQSSWPILRDQQSFQTEFDPYASPNRCYTRKKSVLPLRMKASQRRSSYIFRWWNPT